MKPAFWNNHFVLQVSDWFGHHHLAVAVLAGIVVPLLVPKTWKMASERFEKRHEKFLWVVVIAMLLAIPFVFYRLSH